jgi:hypothetical protein
LGKGNIFLLFDVLSNEKSRKSWRGFNLLTLTHCWRLICQQNTLLKYFPPKNKKINIKWKYRCRSTDRLKPLQDFLDFSLDSTSNIRTCVIRTTGFQSQAKLRWFCLKMVTGTTKNACAYFSKCRTKIVPFYLCPVPKCVFSVFNFRINLKNVVYKHIQVSN